IHAVIGTDVIEHIYSLDHFFAFIAEINTEMLTVFTTASNPHNFIKNRKLKKLQLQDELQGGDPSDSVLAGAEKNEAFIVLRRKIIEDNFPSFNHDEVIQLSQVTRGLNKPSILKAVNLLLTTGKMPEPDIHVTNTCNPLTGSWTERILPIKKYQEIYSSNGFYLQVHNGFYNNHAAGLKKYLNIILNIIVKIAGKYAAPFISLVGYKSR
ncbi:MAG: hypothetical protein H7X88_00830, partial [Gloeobacteraceae cyanobacterium ES-bin-316]|nr:hypothetical protein [Ferruginibacter sp.]